MKNVRSYEQGDEVVPGYVYLCFCLQGCFNMLPWKSKNVYETFFDRTGDRYVHVIVLKEEWNRWREIEGTPASKNGTDCFGEPRIKAPPRILKKQTLVWQHNTLLKLLKRRGEIPTEKITRVKTVKPDSSKRYYARLEGLRVVKAVVPKVSLHIVDPNIDTYTYDIIIHVVGSLWVFTTDLKEKVRITTDRYFARVVPEVGNDMWLMMRHPPGTGKIEYGLTIRQWKQYERSDGMSVSVSIYGLD